ncbi:MAG: OmpA family protein [Bacteroidia bacterium]
MQKKSKIAITLFIAGAALFASLHQANAIKFPWKRNADKQKYMEADLHFGEENYGAALPLYLEIYQRDSSNANLAYKIGLSMLNMQNRKHDAEAYLLKASGRVNNNYRESSLKERNAPPIAYYYYGQAAHLNMHFDLAIQAFEAYKAFVPEADTRLKADVDLRITQCNNGKFLTASPVNVVIENIGQSINSEFPEYAPVLSADERTLIFTTRRPTNMGGQVDPRDGMYFEDIYQSTRDENGSWSAAAPIGNNINTAGHEATIGLSVDGQQLFIYKDDQGDGNVYSSNQVGSNWAAPVKMTENVNSKGWEPSACVSPDGNTLYFTSNREGGLGGRDIWKSVKLPNGQWSKPMNVGAPINTPYDEDAPSIQADGVTLYYASNGAKSMGGFDILVSSFSEETMTWLDPMNIGYPVNTTDDDLYYIPTADNAHAYYSSAESPNGAGEKDICYLTFPDRQQKTLTVLSGEITSIFGGVPPGTSITVTDVETGELVGTYQPNSATGRYVIILPPGKNYSISYEAEDFLYQSDNVNITDSTDYQMINRPVELEPLKVGQKIIVRNIFFDSGKSMLKPESKLELDKLVTLMKKYPKLVIEIAGHTDASGSDELNQRLSEQRAIAVANYLIENGIEKERLKTIGFGEKKPIAINNNPNGTPNKQGMALNRRFEFTILSVDGKFTDIVQPIDVPEKLKSK